MKRKLVLAIASALLLLSGRAAEPEQPLSLRGIIWITDPTLPPIKKVSLRISGRFPAEPLLSEGDRQGAVTVESILPQVGKILVKDASSQQSIEVVLPGAIVDRVDPPTFQFRSLSIGTVVDLLQMLTSRTIIAPAPVLHQRIDLTSAALRSRSEAASVLEETLRTNGLVFQFRAEKFALLVPTSATNLLSAIADPPISERPAKETLPPGLIKFNDADVVQALDFYQALSERTVIYPSRLAEKVAIRTETALVRDEAVWTMNAMFRLVDLVVITEGEKFVFAVPPSMTNALPHFDRKAGLAKARKAITGPPAPIKINTRELDQILMIAAAAMGREPVLTGVVPTRGWFNLRTPPLDQAEAIYTLEAWAQVNGIAFELIEPDKITATLLRFDNP